MSEIVSMDIQPRAFSRIDIAIWIRKNLGVHVDFEDWDGLTEDQFCSNVCRMHNIDITKVKVAMKIEDDYEV